MSIFRAYDIRGIYGKDLTEKTMLNIGKALGTLIEGKNICVGYDTRKSSKKLFEALSSGLTSTGCNVVSLGMVANPMLYFYAWKNKMFGALITASVDADEFTLIMDNNGRKELVKVGPFIDERIKNKDWYKYKVLSFNPDNGNVNFSEIENAFKHKIDEDLFEIQLAYGRNIKVTGSHSVYTYKSGSLVCVPTTELRVGDLVPATVFIKPPKSSSIKINVAKELHNHRKNIKDIMLKGNDILKIVKKRMLSSNRVKKIKLKKSGKKIILKRRKKLNLSRREVSSKCGISPQTIQRIELETNRDFVKLRYIKKYLKFLNIETKKILKSFTEKIDFFKGSWKDGRTLNKIKLREISNQEIQSIEDCVLYCPGGKRKINNVIKISPEFARLIGYYTAEGNIENECRVRFSLGDESEGHERIIIRDIKNIIKKIFGILPHIYHKRNGTVIALDNSVAYYIFAKIFGFEGDVSKTKEIPNIIFNLPLQHQLEFLKGLFLGDGTLTSRYMKFTSSSFKLINALSYLLLNFNVKYSFKVSKGNGKQDFNIVISNYGDMKKLKEVWSSHWNADNVVKVKKCRRRDVYKRFKNLVLLPIKRIKKVKSTSEYVYDFSVKNETFIAGVGGVCCHNSHNPKNWNGLKMVRPTGVSFIEEIKKIEEIYNSEKFIKGKGNIIKKDVIKDYKRFLENKFGIVRKKVVVECFGAAGVTGLPILRSLGLDIISLHDKPDGNFFGFTRPEPKGDNLNMLKRAVKREKADFGVAFDGDADRSVFVDDKSRELNGSLVGTIFIKYILSKKKGSILLTADCASEIEDVVKKLGGKSIWWRVGHGFIEQKSLKARVLFATEQSSHFYFNEFYPFSDGILATVYLAKILSESKERLSELINKTKMHPIEKMYINVGSDENKLRIVEDLKKRYPNALDVMDGIKIKLNDIEWVLIRASQNMPEINLCIEGKNEKRMKDLVREYTKLIKQV